MFKKVLIAEDLDSISITVIQALQELAITEIHHSKYCDDALLKIKKGLLENSPYDLIISDLSFKIDHRENVINSGEVLIEAIKKIQPSIKSIIFSIEDKTYRIKSLFNDLGINAYVCKGRNSIPQLQKAVRSIYDSNTKVVSAELEHILNDRSLIEIESYDIALLQFLSKGLTHDEISIQFKIAKFSPNGTSSIEKRINKLRTYFKASNNVHLIAIAKDLGLV